MGKRVDEYIEQYTRNYSNELSGFVESGDFYKTAYSPWLTPKHARVAAQIAKEEVIEKAVAWLCERYNKQGYLDLDDVDDLKKELEGSV